MKTENCDFIEVYNNQQIWHDRLSGQFFVLGSTRKTYLLNEARFWTRKPHAIL